MTQLTQQLMSHSPAPDSVLCTSRSINKPRSLPPWPQSKSVVGTRGQHVALTSVPSAFSVNVTSMTSPQVHRICRTKTFSRSIFGEIPSLSDLDAFTPSARTPRSLSRCPPALGEDHRHPTCQAGKVPTDANVYSSFLVLAAIAERESYAYL